MIIERAAGKLITLSTRRIMVLTRMRTSGFLHAVVKSGAEAVAAYRLKALAKADNDRVDEKHKTADNGHGRNRSVTIRLTHKVHQDRSHTGNSLTS